MEMMSAAAQKLDFLNLLVTELRNQNPLEPMDNQQMAAQLAQFSQLELSEKMNGQLSTINGTMEKMNGSFEGAMLVAQLDFARSLLGKQVSFYEPDNGTLVTGQVEKIEFISGRPTLRVKAEMPDSGQQEYYVSLEGVEGIE